VGASAVTEIGPGPALSPRDRAISERRRRDGRVIFMVWLDWDWDRWEQRNKQRSKMEVPVKNYSEALNNVT
jgi:hypothetical protein